MLKHQVFFLYTVFVPPSITFGCKPPQACKKKEKTSLDMCTQTEMCSQKGEEIGCQTAALTPPIDVNKKVPVMLKQSRAKRPPLHNTIHAQVHVCLAAVYTMWLSGNWVFFPVFLANLMCLVYCTTEGYYIMDIALHTLCLLCS